LTDFFGNVIRSSRVADAFTDFWANIDLLAAEQGVTDSELARRGGYERQHIYLLRRQTNVTTRTLERIAGALGYEVRIELHRRETDA